MPEVSRVTVEAIPDAADSLQYTSGDDQSAPVNSDLPQQLVVRVVDQYGNGVSGVTGRVEDLRRYRRLQLPHRHWGARERFPANRPNTWRVLRHGVQLGSGRLADEFSYT